MFRKTLFRSQPLVLALALAVGLSALPALGGSGSLDASGDLELIVNFRFPPGPEYLDEIENVFTGAARLLCDATDGQMILDTVTFTEGQISEDSADVWVHLEAGKSRGGAILVTNDSGIPTDLDPGLGSPGAHISWLSSGRNSAVLAHELGHYLFGLGEQYAQAPRSGPFVGDNCGIGPGFETDDSDPTLLFDAQNNSLMGAGITRCLLDASPQYCNSGDCIVCSVDEDCAPGRSCIEIGSSNAEDGYQVVVGAYSEFSTPANHDQRQGTGSTCPMACTPLAEFHCTASWDHVTDRFEGTQQTLIHGESDWETIDEKYPGIFTIPAGLPDIGPASCATVQPTFIDNLANPDQVILLLDRSLSMRSSVRSNVEEICDNGHDDDSDGDTDEDNCAQSRVDFARAAARAFVDLQQDSGIEVGIVLFNDTTALQRGLGELNPGNLESFFADIDNFNTGFNTAIGAGIERSRDEFLAALDIGGTQTILLLSDGKNNVDPDPLASAVDFRDDIQAAGGVPRIFTVPVSDSADEELMSDLAGVGSAMMIQAPTGDELPAIFAEIANVYSGNALVLPRTDGVVSAPGAESYPIPVEVGAEALNLFIAGRNARMSTWDVGYVLQDPLGATYQEESCVEISDPYYCRFRTEDPEPGIWWLHVSAAAAGDQHFTVLASVENPSPDCFVDASPRVQTSETEPTLIEGGVFFKTSLDEGPTLAGSVRRPDGTNVPFNLLHDANYAHSAVEFADYVGRGVYEARLACVVPDGTKPAPGEPIFDGPERPDVRVRGFTRYATQSMFLDVEDFPPCYTSDCDGDGLHNGIDVCGLDTDLDGRPDCRDGDADGDEIPDSVEGAGDADFDGTPDFLDTDSDGDGIADVYDLDPTVKAICDCTAPWAIRGSRGADHLTGTAGDDIICAYDGDDVVHGGGGNDCIDAGDGEDRVYGEAGDDLIRGGDGDDQTWGGTGEDLLIGGNGDDTAYGEAGADLIFGDDGGDRLSGGDGEDRVFGGPGFDLTLGGAGDDLLDGGADDDDQHGGAGFDLCIAGESETGCEL